MVLAELAITPPDEDWPARYRRTYALAFSEDSSLIAALDENRRIQVWRVEPAQGSRTVVIINLPMSIGQDVGPIAFGPDQRLFVSSHTGLHEVAKLDQGVSR